MKGSGSDQDGPRPGGCRAVEIKDTLNRSTWTPHARNGRMPASASVVDGTTVDDGCRLVLHPVAGRLASRDLFRAALTARHTNGDGGAVSASPRQSTAAGLFGEGVFGGGGGSGRVETGHDTRRRQAPAWLPAIVAAGTRAPAVIRSEGTGCACAAPLCSLCLRSCPSAKPGLAAGLSLQSAHRACRTGGSPARVARGHHGLPSFTPRIGWSVCLRVCGACTFGAIPAGHALGIL